MAAIGRGHKARALLVPRQDQFDCFRIGKALQKIEVLLAWNTKDIFNALFFETLDKQIGRFRSIGHRSKPPSKKRAVLAHLLRHYSRPNGVLLRL